MMSATVAGGGAECCAEASAMICSLGDPITLLLFDHTVWPEAARACVAVAARMRWDGARRAGALRQRRHNALESEQVKPGEIFDDAV
jgi:hypothetical protein